MKHTRKMLIGMAMLCLPLPLLIMFQGVKESLLSSGFLNTRDLGFVGGESGTSYEYLTNIWHWDALGGALMFLSLIGLVVGPVLIWKNK